jgi:hypothetical protein
MGYLPYKPDLQSIWRTSSPPKMESISARCLRTGIGVLTGVVDT